MLREMRAEPGPRRGSGQSAGLVVRSAHDKNGVSGRLKKTRDEKVDFICMDESLNQVGCEGQLEMGCTREEASRMRMMSSWREGGNYRT